MDYNSNGELIFKLGTVPDVFVNFSSDGLGQVMPFTGIIKDGSFAMTTFIAGNLSGTSVVNILADNLNLNTTITINNNTIVSNNTKKNHLNSTKNVLKTSKSRTIPLQNTGTPFTGILFPILAIMGGVMISKRKEN